MKRLSAFLALLFYVSILPALPGWAAPVVKDLIVKDSPWTDVRSWKIIPGDNTPSVAAQNAAIWNQYIADNMAILIPEEGFYVTDNGALPGTGSGNCLLKYHDNNVIFGMGKWLSPVTNISTSKVRTFCNEDQVNGNGGTTFRDFTIIRTVLTGSYVPPVSNWNEQIVAEALGGTGLNLKNINIDQMAFYSPATPLDANDKVTHFRGCFECSVTNSTFWGNFSNATTFSESESGGYVNVYNKAVGNFIYNPTSDAYASVYVGGAAYVDILNNDFYVPPGPIGANAITFVEMGGANQGHWKIDGNWYRVPKGNFTTNLAGKDTIVSNNDITGTDNSTTPPAISFSANGACVEGEGCGANFIRRIKVFGNILNNAYISFSTTDNQSRMEDVEIYKNTIDFPLPTDYPSDCDPVGTWCHERFGINLGFVAGSTVSGIKARDNFIKRTPSGGISFTGPTTGPTYIEDNDIQNVGGALDVNTGQGIYMATMTGAGPRYVNRNTVVDNQASPTMRIGVEFDQSNAHTVQEFEGNRVRGATSSNIVPGLATFLSKTGNKFTINGKVNGTSSLVSGVDNIVTTEAPANGTGVILSRTKGAGTGRGFLVVDDAVAGAWFSVKSVDASNSTVTTDNSAYTWWIKQ